jgi:hypothetical protein
VLDRRDPGVREPERVGVVGHAAARVAVDEGLAALQGPVEYWFIGSARGFIQVLRLGISDGVALTGMWCCWSLANHCVRDVRPSLRKGERAWKFSKMALLRFCSSLEGSYCE